MSIPSSLRSEVLRLGGDPTDLVWDWFLFRGPHGNSFTWSRTRKKPPGYIGLKHLKEIVAEFANNEPEFIRRAHAIAKAALLSVYPEIVRRGIQVIAVIGDISDFDKIEALTAHQDDSIQADAKACIFELKKLIKCRT